MKLEKMYGDEPLNEWIYEAEDALCYRGGDRDSDPSKCLLHDDLKEIAQRHQERVRSYLEVMMSMLRKKIEVIDLHTFSDGHNYGAER